MFDKLRKLFERKSKNGEKEKRNILLLLVIIPLVMSNGMLVFLIGMHSIDNSLNALIFLGYNKWFQSCDLTFTGNCFQYPHLYMFGMVLLSIGLCIFGLGFFGLGYLYSKLNHYFKESKIIKKQVKT